jgi:hypothetical protein
LYVVATSIFQLLTCIQRGRFQGDLIMETFSKHIEKTKSFDFVSAGETPAGALALSAMAVSDEQTMKMVFN